MNLSATYWPDDTNSSRSVRHHVYTSTKCGCGSTKRSGDLTALVSEAPPTASEQTLKASCSKPVRKIIKKDLCPAQSRDVLTHICWRLLTVCRTKLKMVETRCRRMWAWLIWMDSPQLCLWDAPTPTTSTWGQRKINEWIKTLMTL